MKDDSLGPITTRPKYAALYSFSTHIPTTLLFYMYTHHRTVLVYIFFKLSSYPLELYESPFIHLRDRETFSIVETRNLNVCSYTCQNNLKRLFGFVHYAHLSIFRVFKSAFITVYVLRQKLTHCTFRVSLRKFDVLFKLFFFFFCCTRDKKFLCKIIANVFFTFQLSALSRRYDNSCFNPGKITNKQVELKSFNFTSIV